MRWLFGDWEPVWADQGQYSLDGYLHSTVVFEIQYSKKKRKFRLITRGYLAKQHPRYPYAVKTLASYLEAHNEKNFT